jgi:opacity protein-like surface antigen
MIRKNLLLGVAVFVIAGVSTVNAASNGFVRPVVAYVSPTADGYDDAGYLGVQVGVFVGANRNHEFSGEIGSTGWESDERIGSLRSEATETYVPILASYRFYAGASDAPVRFFFGPSIGLTAAAYEVEVTGPGVFRKDDSSELLFTAAANVGLDFRINDRFSINLGYRYIYIDGTEIELFGLNLDLDDSKAHIVSTGLTIRF